MRYTTKEFDATFPTDDACLDYMFISQFGNMQACPKCGVIEPRYYRVRNRKCYECRDCGYQIHPLAGTIFHKSSTSLRTWFQAIFMFSISKNSVAAKELQRASGVTYKCALRMGHKIRDLMKQDPNDRLVGLVEGDETYVGGKRRGQERRWDNKTPILGLVERKGNAKAIVAAAHATNALKFISDSLDPEAELHTDDSKIYHRVSRTRVHEVINHSKREYARGHVNTNTIEGLWSQIKRSIDGTHHAVSPKHLQKYVDFHVFQYNHRGKPAFPTLIERAAKPA